LLGKREGAKEARIAEKIAIVNRGQAILKESEWLSVHPENCLLCPQKIGCSNAICLADDREHQASAFRREFAVKSSYCAFDTASDYLALGAEPRQQRSHGFSPTFARLTHLVGSSLQVFWYKGHGKFLEEQAMNLFAQQARGRLRIENNSLVVGPLKAEDEQPSLVTLEALVDARLPLVELPDLLMEVDGWTGFSRHLERVALFGYLRMVAKGKVVPWREVRFRILLRTLVNSCAISEYQSSRAARPTKRSRIRLQRVLRRGCGQEFNRICQPQISKCLFNEIAKTCSELQPLLIRCALK
jgi:hypothetical protein